MSGRRSDRVFDPPRVKGAVETLCVVFGDQLDADAEALASLDKAAETPGDLKEMWNVCFGSDTPAADHPPPRWPAESEREQLAYRAYDRALAGLADTLYRVCALALGLEEDWFVPKIALFLIASLLISSDCLPHQVRTQDCSLLNCLPHQL